MEQSQIFRYTYRSEYKQEVLSIRRKYLPQAERTPPVPKSHCSKPKTILPDNRKQIIPKDDK